MGVGIALVVVVAVPIVIVLLAIPLRNLYGDQLFSLSWPAHDLNNPDDPRILKLKLDESAEHSTRVDGSRGIEQ